MYVRDTSMLPLSLTIFETLSWPPERPAEQCNMLSFRGEQLEFRRMEIFHVFRAIQSLVRDGRNDTRYPLETIGDTRIDWSRWSTVDSRKPIECEENVVLAGHSFGGATVVSVVVRVVRDVD